MTILMSGPTERKKAEMRARARARVEFLAFLFPLTLESD